VNTSSFSLTLTLLHSPPSPPFTHHPPPTIVTSRWSW
jgi:hypothetical protein